MFGSMSPKQQIATGVEQAEQERCRAVGEQDWPALDALLSDDLTHTHMNGRVDNKQALLASIKRRPRTLRRGALTVRAYGEIAIMTGPQYLSFGSPEIENQVTQVWQRSDGRWRLLAFHASTANPQSR